MTEPFHAIDGVSPTENPTRGPMMSSTPWGVDLSPTYNAIVDAQAVKDAGASYVILKVSEGVGWPDQRSHPDEFSWFARVAADVQAVGLELRTYHLATPLGPEDAIGEAAWFDKHRGDIPPGASLAYDLEVVPPVGPSVAVRSFDSWAAQVGGWFPESLVELYVNRYVLHEIEPWLRNSTPLWLAFPGWLPGTALPGPNPIVRIQIGQRTIAGVAGNIDVDVSPGATLADVTEAFGTALPTRPPAPQPTPATDWTLAVRTVDLRNAASTPVHGLSVKSLQVLLNLDGRGLVVDGVAGQRTRDALAAYQRLHHLSVDLVAGPQTWGALCSQ